VQVTGVKWFKDNWRFVTRGTDNTMRVFDIRNFDRPVDSVYELYNNYGNLGVEISPCEKYLVTSISPIKSSARLEE
jgi:WD40 repeat protein